MCFIGICGGQNRLGVEKTDQGLKKQARGWQGLAPVSGASAPPKVAKPCQPLACFWELFLDR